MSKIVTANAKMQCTLGVTIVPLTVTSQFICKISGGLVATEMDKNPMVNIASFGTCKCGTPPPPCIPSPVTWQKTSVIHNIMGQKSLTTDSFCMCAKGGKISFIDAGADQHVDSK